MGPSLVHFDELSPRGGLGRGRARKLRPRLETIGSALPIIAAHPLRARQKPFDDPDWLFELKYDGYRALLY
jgi:ATP-dependent DNA ligase